MQYFAFLSGIDEEMIWCPFLNTKLELRDS